MAQQQPRPQQTTRDEAMKAWARLWADWAVRKAAQQRKATKPR